MRSALAYGYGMLSHASAAYRVTSVILDPIFSSVGSKPVMRHHEHSRVTSLYHENIGLTRSAIFQ